MAQNQNDGTFAVLEPSLYATRTSNPIRKIIQSLQVPKRDDGKKPIPLSIGDPTVFGNFKAPSVLIKAIQDAVMDFSNHGYKHSAGMESARQAIATRHSKLSNRIISVDDVIIASGCSGALEIAIKALCSEGDNLLVPKPGFSLYETLAASNGISVGYYPLIPEKSWEADLVAMEAAINEKTKAILVNNPSNPCGSVFSKEHLQAILSVAEKHGLPIIADEIYGNIVFEGHTFFPLAGLTTTVPILEVGGIAKEFLVPGFRIGWIIMHDAPAKEAKDGFTTALGKVRGGAMSLTQLLVGPNTIMQAALPSILTPVSGSEEEGELIEFHKKTVRELEDNAMFLAERLIKIPGIRVIVPQGAMYVMIGLDAGKIGIDDVTFAQRLVQEELVILLPGTCFGMKNFLRIVFCAPREILEDACDRIESFCEKNFAVNTN